MMWQSSDLSDTQEDDLRGSFQAPIDPRAITQIPQLRKYLSVLTLGNIIIAFLHIVKSLSLAAVIVEVITRHQEKWAHIAHLLIITFIVFSFLTVINGFCAAYSEHQPDKFGAQLAIDRAFRRLIYLPEQVFLRYKPQFQSGMAMQTESIRPYFTEFIPALVSTFTLVPIVIAAITYVDWLSGVIILALLPCIPIFMVLIGQLTADKAQTKVTKMENLAQSVEDTYSGISTLQAMNRPHAADKFLKKVSTQYTEISQQISSIIFLSSAILEFIATFSVAIVAVNIGMRLIYGKISLEAAIFVFIIIAEVYTPLRKVGSAYHASEDGRIYLRNMLAIPDSRDFPMQPFQSSMHIMPFRVEWNDQSTLTFEIDCHINSGDILILRGDNGGGKTTLLRAILGNITVTALEKGNNFQMNYGKENLIYLPTNPLVVPGTIAENFLALTPWLSLSELCEPLTLLGLQDIVKHYNFTADITTLSLGQKQFLLVSRALSIAATRSAQAQILVLLDEPLQFQDQEHAVILENACQLLGMQGVAIIIASHDLGRFLNFPSVEISAISGIAGSDLEKDEVAQFL